MVPEIWNKTDRVFCHFGAISHHFTPLTTQKKSKFYKNEKKLEISFFYTCVRKIMITWFAVPGIWCMTDEQTESDIEVGAQPKNIHSPN